MSDHFDRELFERAFANNSGGCRRTCSCGRIFFDNQDDGGWDWDKNELQQLRENPNAAGLPHAIMTMTIEMNEFVMDCNCWVERAKDITKWLSQNGPGICKWYNLRKEVALAKAKTLPEVKP